MKHNLPPQSLTKTILSGTGLWLLLLTLLIPTNLQAARSSLPPRPTATPTPTATVPAPAPTEESNGTIVLKIRGSETLKLETLWTVVEWQDAGGNWHPVTGWAGPLDSINGTSGEKRWGILPDTRHNPGLFRWSVYEQPEGKCLGNSAPFSLPADNGAIELSLTLTPILLPETGTETSPILALLAGILCLSGAGILIFRRAAPNH